MMHARRTALPMLAVGLLLTGCVASPLYVGPPRSVAASRHLSPVGPGYSGLISHGVVRRYAHRELTNGSEVPRDALGNPVLPDAGPAAAAKPPRHRRKHWFGL